MRSRVAAVLAFAGLSSACTIPFMNELDAASPPAALGRPGWVSYPAQGGAWVGGTIGVLASALTMPLTFPVSLVAEKPLGCARDEFLLWGVSTGAGAGHFLIGAPLDTVDFTFRRAWVSGPPPRSAEEDMQAVELGGTADSDG